LPDIEGRKAILKIHREGKPLVKAVNWDAVAKRTVGFSGADLENMLNEAAILAARGGKTAIDMDDLEEAATKVKLGPEKKRLQSDEDRKITAYHEAGHAVVAFNLPRVDPVHRVSIVARGLALGFVLTPPTKDRYTETRSRLLEQVAAALGGRAAEELVFKELTSGASSDIVKSTKIVRQMVVEYGMSDLGPINFGPQFDTFESGQTFLEPTQLSPQMQARVDTEIKKIIDDCYQRALEVLKKNKKKLDLVAEELLKVETIEGERFKELMGKKD
jgi:cell division protease FtsH